MTRNSITMTSDELLAALDDPTYEDHSEARWIYTTVTPEVAQTLLDRYIRPARRPLNQHHVAELAHRVKHPDPEGNSYEQVFVRSNGRTVAGQHLLHAVIQADTPAWPVWVVLNHIESWEKRVMGQSIREMTDEIREVNTALGWRTGGNTFGDHIALLNTEVAEATEAYRDHRLNDATRPVCGRAANGEEPCPEHGPSKPEGVGSELADLIIRLLDTCDIYNLRLLDTNLELADITPLEGRMFGGVPGTLETFGDHMAWLHLLICLMWTTHDSARLLRAVVTVADRFGFDLAFEYRRKIAYNRTRPYQHGGRTLSEVTP